MDMVLGNIPTPNAWNHHEIYSNLSGWSIIACCHPPDLNRLVSYYWGISTGQLFTNIWKYLPSPLCTSSYMYCMPSCTEKWTGVCMVVDPPPHHSVCTGNTEVCGSGNAIQAYMYLLHSIKLQTFTPGGFSKNSCHSSWMWPNKMLLSHHLIPDLWTRLPVHAHYSIYYQRMHTDTMNLNHWKAILLADYHCGWYRYLWFAILYIQCLPQPLPNSGCYSLAL
jgi:hypothetical protein